MWIGEDHFAAALFALVFVVLALMSRGRQRVGIFIAGVGIVGQILAREADSSLLAYVCILLTLGGGALAFASPMTSRRDPRDK